MIKLYTALGRFEMKRNESGRQYPAVMFHGKEYRLDINEMIVWSNLIWEIHTIDELREICKGKARDAEISGDISCEDCLTRLEEVGLVASGCDYVGIDSMYNLISGLAIVPVNEGIGTKILAFLHMTFIKGVPFKKTKRIFARERLTDDEKLILMIARKSVFTASELTEYFCRKRLPANESVSAVGIEDYAIRRSPEQRGVLQAVVNLYLKKLILFDKE